MHTLTPAQPPILNNRSEEHTSELQSQSNIVCRLLLEKKNTASNTPATNSSIDGLSRADGRARAAVARTRRPWRLARPGHQERRGPPPPPRPITPRPAP